jgi:hypothetical protein
VAHHVELDAATSRDACSREVTYAFTRPEVFVATLHTYLLSGIPMVLALRGDGGGHAVTAVGFQMSGSEHPALQTSVPVRSSRLTKLYVHDDRLGPYARAMIEPYSYRNKKKKVSFEGLSFEIEFDGVGAERWLIDTAIAPVYPKLRLPVASLISLAEFRAKLVEDMVGPKKALALRVDFRYERAGDYLTKLAGRVPDPKRNRPVGSRGCALALVRNRPLVPGGRRDRRVRLRHDRRRPRRTGPSSGAPSRHRLPQRAVRPKRGDDRHHAERHNGLSETRRKLRRMLTWLTFRVEWEFDMYRPA